MSKLQVLKFKKDDANSFAFFSIIKFGPRKNKKNSAYVSFQVIPKVIIKHLQKSPKHNKCLSQFFWSSVFYCLWLVCRTLLQALFWITNWTFFRAKIWAAACKRTFTKPITELHLHKHVRIYSERFESRMFMNDLRNRLFNHAVPTLVSFVVYSYLL